MLVADVGPSACAALTPRDDKALCILLSEHKSGLEIVGIRRLWKRFGSRLAGRFVNLRVDDQAAVGAFAFAFGVEIALVAES